VRRAAVALIFGVVTAATAGCSPTSGQPAPATSGSDVSGSASPSNAGGDAPPVTQPGLDLSRYESNPCSALSASQLAPFGASTSGSNGDSAVGPQCRWRSVDALNGTTVTVAILTKAHGLDGMYRNRSQFPVFRPTQVNGYPAVDGDITDAAQGACTTGVATSQGAGFQVAVHVQSESSPQYKSPCTVSEKIAQTIVGNLKGGG
jgi:hypothetical protein